MNEVLEFYIAYTNEYTDTNIKINNLICGERLCRNCKFSSYTSSLAVSKCTEHNNKLLSRENYEELKMVMPEFFI